MMEIREERDGDRQAVREVNDRAFNQPQEGTVVQRIRDSGIGALSLVACEDGTVAGHILFSPVTIDGHPGLRPGMGLAPMAVLPGRQNRGIGSMLVREGIRILGERGVPYLVVLGHPRYYPRFGFVPASRFSLVCQWDGVPDEAFMVLALEETALRGVSGIARYREEFNEAM